MRSWSSGSGQNGFVSSLQQVRPPTGYLLYERMLRRYADRRFPFNHPAAQAAFERTIQLAVVLLQRARRLTFPRRATGGWYWIWRWRWDFLMGWNEWESVRWAQARARPGSTALDVGAHIGYYTIALSKRVGPHGRVIAVEAHPENATLLRQNTARLEGVEVVQAAVASHRGTATLIESVGHSNHSLIDGFVAPAGAIKVPTTTLDDVMDDLHLTDISLVKIDIEGGEMATLHGMQRLLESHRPYLVVECNPEALAAAGHSPDELVSAIRGHGYAVETITSTGEVVPVTDPSAATVNLVCSPLPAPT